MSILDPFVFTKQTETLLNGIGAQHLIKECKRRNISTDALHKLTKEDFILLGADEAEAEKMVSSLRIPEERNSAVKLQPHEIVFDKIEILKADQKQLNVMEHYMAYCKCRLRKEGIDFFIEPDKALRASQILCLAADSILREVDEAESKLKELEMIIKPKTNSYMWYCISFGGVSLIISLLYFKKALIHKLH